MRRMVAPPSEGRKTVAIGDSKSVYFEFVGRRGCRQRNDGPEN
jgi:hypothetical protein